MVRMLTGIETVAQHQDQLRDNPDSYRPECCPHCGKGGLQRHGHYERNAGVVVHTPFLLPKVPPHLLTVARLSVAQAAVLVGNATGGVDAVDDGCIAA
jgi:hypothetical protein